MSAKNKKQTTVELIAEIHEKLDMVESHLAWLITPSQRFKVGQRIEFSKRALRRNMIPKTRSAARGVIRGFDGFSVRVMMDDRKHANSYHHVFLNPVSGSKLF